MRKDESRLHMNLYAFKRSVLVNNENEKKQKIICIIYLFRVKLALSREERIDEFSRIRNVV